MSTRQHYEAKYFIAKRGISEGVLNDHLTRYFGRGSDYESYRNDGVSNLQYNFSYTVLFDPES